MTRSGSGPKSGVVRHPAQPGYAHPIYHVTTCASRRQKVGCDGDETRPKVVSTALSARPAAAVVPYSQLLGLAKRQALPVSIRICMPP